VANDPALVSVTVGDTPHAWESAGFAVDGAVCTVGRIRFDLGGTGDGIVSSAFTAVTAGPLDGLDIRHADAAGDDHDTTHPNGSVSLDHLVITSHDVGRTRAALTERGFEVRRAVDMGDRRYTFFRVGETILELVGPAVADGDRPARFFGLAFTVADLDATAALLGPRLGEVRDALQPGRRIATVRREAGLSVPVALMSPGPGAI
jgi:hypothetical protein